jgi:hypothetical protein
MRTTFSSPQSLLRAQAMTASVVVVVEEVVVEEEDVVVAFVVVVVGFDVVEAATSSRSQTPLPSASRQQPEP